MEQARAELTIFFSFEKRLRLAVEKASLEGTVISLEKRNLHTSTILNYTVNATRDEDRGTGQTNHVLGGDRIVRQFFVVTP